MERKLLVIIMRPAMVASWVFGLMLVFTPGIVDWGAAWSWVKAGSVLAMTGFQFWLERKRLELAEDRCEVTSRGFRMMNELPTLLMIAIVTAVIVKF
jgi:putative membrane protein